MTKNEVIDIHGGWTSKNGKNKIQILQSLNKFEGFMGSPDDVKISLGNISERTLNFKQTWHKGKNKGAVATVYGTLTADNSTILLEFEGMRANGKTMKGKNAIFRDNISGSWKPSELSEGGDVWSFKLVNRFDISGDYWDSNTQEKVALKGHRDHRDVNFFTISLQPSDEGLNKEEKEIKGEYRRPNIILTLPPFLGDKSVMLDRKQQEALPNYAEYTRPLLNDESKSEVIFNPALTSFSSRKRPMRDESQAMCKQTSECHSEQHSQPMINPDDLRTALLSPDDVTVQNRIKQKTFCCCILLT